MAKLPRRLRGGLAAICYARFSARAGLELACPIMKNTAILLIDCPDRPGIVAAVAGFLYQHGANILHADQHQDNELRLFFMRVEFSLEGFDLPPGEFHAQFEPLARQFAMNWRIEYSSRLISAAIFVSREQHCLIDLLHRHQSGELRCRIPLIISNHPDAKPLADFYSVPFHHIPVEPGKKAEAERRQLELLEANQVELIVLARYMQILSPDFVARYPQRIINVHHSFLPAFSGARPYQAAFRRGVKLIGATSHYVTDELDEGPIIEQDVTRVSHRYDLEDFIERGRDLERIVLARAVRWHLEHRILCYANKTVVFD
jgi:formyltetrahydrofolate deformylase